MNKVRPFDHAWSLLKAAGRMSPVGGSKESQPVGRYNPKIDSSEYDFTNIAPGRSNTSKINPREMVEEAQPPTQYPEGHEFDTADRDLSAGDEGSTRLQEEMMRELESRAGGPPVSSGYSKIPLEQKVEEARGYAPGGEYAGPAPTMGHDSRGIRGEDDSSVYGEAKRFEPNVAPLSQEIYQQR